MAAAARVAAPQMEHELSAVDAAMTDEEMPQEPVVSKQKSEGRLPGGWMWDETRDLYVNRNSLETSKDRPYDRCGTFGCLLQDKQLRPRGSRTCPNRDLCPSTPLPPCL